MGEHKRCLVVYATGSGCTEEVARWIAEELEANGVMTDVRPADQEDARGPRNRHLRDEPLGR